MGPEAATVGADMAKTLRQLAEDAGLRAEDIRNRIPLEPGEKRPVVSAVNHWLAGTYRPRGHRIGQLAKILGVTPDEIRDALDATAGAKAGTPRRRATKKRGGK